MPLGDDFLTVAYVTFSNQIYFFKKKQQSYDMRLMTCFSVSKTSNTSSHILVKSRRYPVNEYEKQHVWLEFISLSDYYPVYLQSASLIPHSFLSRFFLFLPSSKSFDEYVLLVITRDEYVGSTTTISYVVQCVIQMLVESLFLPYLNLRCWPDFNR